MYSIVFNFRNASHIMILLPPPPSPLTSNKGKDDAVKEWKSLAKRIPDTSKQA
jgi:hypothetical protein